MSNSSLQVRPFPADDFVSIGSFSHRIFICGAVIRPQPLVTSTSNGSFKHSSFQTKKLLLTWNWLRQRNEEGRQTGKVFWWASARCNWDNEGTDFLFSRPGKRNLILSTHLCIHTSYIRIYTGTYVHIDT
jgi:hypothetical protein